MTAEDARPTEPLRVAHVLMAGDVDGIGLHVLDLARAQLASGTVSPVVVSCPTQRYAERLHAAGVPIRPLPTHRLLPALRRMARQGPLGAAEDLTHLHGHRASQLLLLSRSLGLLSRSHPVVATCHGFPGGSVRRRARARAELASYRELRLLITTSSEQADRVTRTRRAPPVVYLPNGILLPPPSVAVGAAHVLTAHGVPPGVDVIGAVGRLATEKRHDVFLRACRVISWERPAAHFVLIGDGPQRRRLERLAAELGIAERTHITGVVDNVAQLCSSLSVLMHTSDTEGTPRAVLEAMAVCVPVVATAVGGVPDLVAEGVTGLLTPPQDPGALARAALSLLDHPGRARAMGAAGRARVAASFSVSHMAGRIEDLYRSEVLSRALTSP